MSLPVVISLPVPVLDLRASAVLSSVDAVTNELRARAESHIYHIVDRESQVYVSLHMYVCEFACM